MERVARALIVGWPGIRDVDDTEVPLVHSSGVTVFTMEDVDFLGAREVMRRALEIANRGTAGFHFSFDLDGCDPEVAPGVGTPVQVCGGGAGFCSLCCWCVFVLCVCVCVCVCSSSAQTHAHADNAQYTHRQHNSNTQHR